MNQEPGNKLEKTAYHEAGHAVMAYIIGCRKFKRISIEQVGRATGHITLGSPMVAVQGDVQSQADMIEQILAGNVAVELFTGTSNPEWDDDRLWALGLLHWAVYGKDVVQDFRNVKDGKTAGLIAYCVDEYGETIVTICEGVARQLAENWKAVEAVANALLEKLTLEGGEVLRLLEQAFEHHE